MIGSLSDTAYKLGANRGECGAVKAGNLLGRLIGDFNHDGASKRVDGPGNVRSQRILDGE